MKYHYFVRSTDGHEIKAVSRSNKTSSSSDWREAKRFSRSCIRYLVIIIAANSIDCPFILHVAYISPVFSLLFNVSHFCDKHFVTTSTMYQMRRKISLSACTRATRITCACAVESSFHHRINANRIEDDTASADENQ